MVAWLLLAIGPSAALTLWRWRRDANSGWGWPPAAAVLLVAASLAVLAILFVGRYWTFYHLHTPLSGLALFILYLPIVHLLVAGSGLLTLKRARRWGWTRGRGLFAAWMVMTTLVVALVAVEVVTSTDERSREGEGAGALAPFFRSQVGS